MSVIIKNMEMPKSCVKCCFGDRFSSGERIECYLSKINFPYYYCTDKRFELCPLEECK